MKVNLVSVHITQGSLLHTSSIVILCGTSMTLLCGTIWYSRTANTELGCVGFHVMAHSATEYGLWTNLPQWQYMHASKAFPDCLATLTSNCSTLPSYNARGRVCNSIWLPTLQHHSNAFKYCMLYDMLVGMVGWWSSYFSHLSLATARL